MAFDQKRHKRAERTCYADEVTHRNCKYSINRGWRERTCRIEEIYGNQYCTCCGEMVGTWDSESELCVSSNMVELWNYCPNCGAKVVLEINPNGFCAWGERKENGR